MIKEELYTMLDTISQTKYIDKRLISLFIIGFFITIIIDTSLVRIYDLVSKNVISPNFKLLVFSVNTSLCLLFQIGILFYLSKIFKQDRFKISFLIFKKYHSIALISVLAMAILISSVIFNLFDQNMYNKYQMMFSIILCYSSAIFFFIVLGKLFYSWYKVNHKYLIFLYLLSVILITFNLVATGTITVLKIHDKPEKIREYVGITSFSKLGKYTVLDTIYTISSILSFVSLWITTFILVTTYRKKSLRNIIFLMVLLLPLIYFGTNYVIKYYITDIFNSFAIVGPFILSVSLIVVFSLSYPIGGITFGLLFWRTSKAVSYEKDVVGFILIAGYGIMLVFSANQATSLIITPYPPFGLSTISILTIAAYMTLVGIYNSAKMVSINNELRRSIVKITIESRMLNLMGEAEKQKEVETIIMRIHNDSAISEIENDVKQGPDLDQDELRKYIYDVINELHHENQEGKFTE